RYWSGTNDAALAVQALSNPIYAPATSYEGKVYITTRDNFVLELDPGTGTVERDGISGQTNYAVVVFDSDLIVDRRLYIIADLDNVLRAIETSTGVTVWEQSCTSRVMTDPVIRDGRLLVVLAEGTLLAFDPDNGNLLESIDIGDLVPAAWSTDNGVAGFTMNGQWSYAPEGLTIRPLPAVVKAGGPGIFLSNENRVYLATDDEAGWRQVAPMRERLTAAPLAWQGHAVLTHGETVTVMGHRPFEITAEQAMLAPVVLDDQLVLVSADGLVRFYEP
ncbi:MAG: PQQ-binding-like beta-propeller repeat protein, partial [Planctomycetota bacterium]